MKEIKLTQGMIALIDDEDFEKVNQYKWRARKSKKKHYATSQIKEKKGIHLHNLIMNPPPGFVVDHEDRDGLNCQKSNMRICTNIQNKKNRTAWGASKYLGVAILRRKNYIKWEARIFNNKTSFYLGCYLTEEDAARAYDKAAKDLHGEFANLNFR